MKPDYPTATDITDRLTDCGVSTAGLDAATAAALGRSVFERRAGRVFKHPAAPETRSFDPPTGPDGRLDLRMDLDALQTVQYQPQGAAAETLANGTDYWPLPHNAEGRPIRALAFRRRWALPLADGLRNSILLTGYWSADGTGGTGIPDEVWAAMVDLGCLWLLAPAGTDLSDARTYYDNLGVKTSWSTSPYRSVIDQMTRSVTAIQDLWHPREL